MNQERLAKIIEDLQECLTDMDECLYFLQNKQDDKTIQKLSKSSLRQLFFSFHIILEDFCSITLKEIKNYKIGISLYDSFNILKENNIIDDSTYLFLEKSRLIRNRISHRYKEPSHEELFNHILKYHDNFYNIITLAKSFVK